MLRRLTPLILPLGLLVSTTAEETESRTHTHLLHVCLAWAIIAAVLLWRRGFRNKSTQSSWPTSVYFVASDLCARAAGERAVTRWTASLLPLAVYLASERQVYGDVALTNFQHEYPKSYATRLNWIQLIMASICGIALLAPGQLAPSTLLLSIGSTIFLALAFTRLKAAYEACSSYDQPHDDGVKERVSTSASDTAHAEVLARDIAIGVFVLSSFTFLWIEFPYVSSVLSMAELGKVQHLQIGTWQHSLMWNFELNILKGTVIELVYSIVLLAIIHRSSMIQVPFYYSAGIMTAALYHSPTQTHLTLYVILISIYAIFLVSRNSRANSSILMLEPAYKPPIRQMLLTITLSVLLVACLAWEALGRTPSVISRDFVNLASTSHSLQHPMEHLITESTKSFESKLSAQSKSLGEAVATYRRRYGIPPPPKFDIWYEFAQARNVKMIDEFDTMHKMLTPFWALEPHILRRRVVEALGFENSLLPLLIRDGTISHIGSANTSSTTEWQSESLFGMIQSFVHHLPDMDLAFNLHDEPRVIVPHDTLSSMMHLATTDSMPEAMLYAHHKNAFSPRPSDISQGLSTSEVRATRFNKFSRQHTWSHSRISCAPDSPARQFSDSAEDNTKAYATGHLGFIGNTTAFADICQTPSFRNSFGFFDRPNVFNVVQDLIPIFSQSKISSFQDILYPSQWYWADQVKYRAEEDPVWEAKNATLYWRGSTTGGFSRKGGWRRQHRQHAVKLLNEHSSTEVLSRTDDSDWQARTVPRQDYSDLIDVAFSHIGQCDPSDCVAQQEFFRVLAPEPQARAWSSRLLFDIDGNAFSGRFISFLRSRSLVLKMALFQEWHADWLQPWLHYVPVSLKGDEWLETVRYLAGGKQGDASGEAHGRALAEAGRHWAGMAMRKEDMEVWFFRLLLEYGRLIDDHRSEIGFVGH